LPPAQSAFCQRQSAWLLPPGARRQRFWKMTRFYWEKAQFHGPVFPPPPRVPQMPAPQMRAATESRIGDAFKQNAPGHDEWPGALFKQE